MSSANSKLISKVIICFWTNALPHLRSHRLDYLRFITPDSTRFVRLIWQLTTLWFIHLFFGPPVIIFLANQFRYFDPACLKHILTLSNLMLNEIGFVTGETPIWIDSFPSLKDFLVDVANSTKEGFSSKF